MTEEPALPENWEMTMLQAVDAARKAKRNGTPPAQIGIALGRLFAGAGFSRRDGVLIGSTIYACLVASDLVE